MATAESLPVEVLPLVTRHLHFRKRNNLFRTTKGLYRIHLLHAPPVLHLALAFHTESTYHGDYPVTTLTLLPASPPTDTHSPPTDSASPPIDAHSDSDPQEAHLLVQWVAKGEQKRGRRIRKDLVLEVTFKKGVSEVRWCRHEEWCGCDVMVGVVAVNGYGGRMLEEKNRMKVHLPSKKYNYYCWNGEAQVHLYDGGTKSVEDVRIGDVLLGASGSPTVVRRIKETVIRGEYKMVDMGDFYITRGHPIYWNEEWYRPDELFEVSTTYVDVLYNFYAEPEHFLVVGRERVVCSSLGGYCPRLAELDVFTDVLYGRGYGSCEAEQYKWLLSLKERIPDDQVYPRVPLFYEDLYPGRENIVILGRTPVIEEGSL